MTRRAVALAFALLLLAPAALGQDLTPRRGFKVVVTEPKNGDVVSGRTKIVAEVTAQRETDVDRVDFLVDDVLVFSDTEPPWLVIYDFGSQAGARVIRVVAHHHDGPTVSDFVVTRALDLQYTVNVQRVVLDVSVRDEKNRVVTGLSAGDFSVTEDGRPQRVSAVSTEKRPMLVGILLDSSGSMKEKIEEAQNAACRFTDVLLEQDRAFVIDFDDAVYLIQEATGDHEQLCEAIRSTQALGGTAFFDAIHAAYRKLYETPAERRALVLLTDGDDTESRIEFDQVMRESRLSDVTIFSIGLDVPGMSSARSSLSRLSEETGGRSFFIARAEELADTYALIAEELRTMYQVVYASDNKVFDNRFIRVNVRVEAPGRIDVRHRSGYHAAVP